MNSNIKDKLCVALDGFSKIEDLKSRVIELKSHVEYFKVGSESFTKFGREPIEIITESKCKVFLDLKFHDIPNTVMKSCEAANALGVTMLTVHSLGGLEMLKAAKLGAGKTKVIGVTVLTSDGGDVIEEILKRAKLCFEAGLDGIVCSAQDIIFLKQHFPKNFIFVTPGISIDGKIGKDQKRTMDAKDALHKGSSLLVIGRAINNLRTKEERIKAITSLEK